MYIAPPDSGYSDISRGNSYASQGPADHDFAYMDPGPSNLTRNPSDLLRDLAGYGPRGPLELHDEVEGEYWEEEEDDDENRFVNFSLLSHIAVQLRDKVPRGTHVKGSIPYPRAFTGKDIVVRSFVILVCASPLKIRPVNHPISDSTRVSHQPQHFNKRSARRTSGRSQSSKPALLLRS